MGSNLNTKTTNMIDWTEFSKVKNPSNMKYMREDRVVQLEQLENLLENQVNDLRTKLEDLVAMKRSQQFFVPEGVNIFYKHYDNGRVLTIAYIFNKDTKQVCYGYSMYRPDYLVNKTDEDDYDWNWDKEVHRYTALVRLQKKAETFTAKSCFRDEVKTEIRKHFGARKST